MLNFFAEALEEKDILENPVLKQGDTVIIAVSTMVDTLNLYLEICLLKMDAI